MTVEMQFLAEWETITPLFSLDTNDHYCMGLEPVSVAIQGQTEIDLAIAMLKAAAIARECVRLREFPDKDPNHVVVTGVERILVHG